jgi:hypothetical protein
VLTRSTCVASLLAIAGCKGEKPPDCEATLSAAIDRMVGEARRSLSGSAFARIEPNAPRLRQALHASCVADEWSPAALRCFSAATLPLDIEACTAKLTHEQYERVHKKIDPLLAPAVDPTPASPATGSAAGSGDAAPSQPASSAGGGSAAAGSAARPPAGRAEKPVEPQACSHTIVDPSNEKCRKQYCRAHPDDLRCSAYE